MFSNEHSVIHDFHVADNIVKWFYDHDNKYINAIEAEL